MNRIRPTGWLKSSRDGRLRRLPPDLVMSAIDTDGYSRRLRHGAVDLGGMRLLVSDLRDTAQEGDLSEPVNCGGYGRIRHFTRATGAGWPDSPLPIEPAATALGLPAGAQVFQNAACNWRCWWRFVPFGLLSANPARSAMRTAGELAEAHLAVPDRPPVLDLSGGQPDLVPEWVPWTLRALDERGVTGTYLWSDDNLSTDYFFTHLTAGSHHPPGPQHFGHDSRQSGEDGTVGPGHARSRVGPAQHGHLVPQREYLHVLGRRGPGRQR